LRRSFRHLHPFDEQTGQDGDAEPGQGPDEVTGAIGFLAPGEDDARDAGDGENDFGKLFHVFFGFVGVHEKVSYLCPWILNDLFGLGRTGFSFGSASLFIYSNGKDKPNDLNKQINSLVFIGKFACRSVTI
jgi:hypothetical protein